MATSNFGRMLQRLLLHFTILITIRASEKEPRFNVVTKNVTVVAGQTAVLPCSVDNLGTYRVVWQSPRGKTLTLEDRRIISDERISLERPYVKEWNLHVREVKLTDEGTYQCQINTNPVQVRPVKLHVHEPAKIIDHLSSSESITVKEGETVELVCNVTGLPTPSVTWYRIYSGLMEHEGDSGKKSIGKEGEVLVIHNVSRYCDDTYECVAYNGVHPADTREMRVHVEFPPEVRLPNKKISQDKGKSTILECEVTAYPHIMTVWRRNGREITRSAKYTTEIYNEGGNKVTLSLKVQSITDDDFGDYVCYAKNELGDDSETMLLYEHQKPEERTTTTTTTTTRTPSHWSQNAGGGDEDNTYRTGENHQRHLDGHSNGNQANNHWQEKGTEQDNSGSSGDRGTEKGGYSPYNKWGNPEYSYEPEAESGSVISDPEGGENGASSTSSKYSLFLLLLMYLQYIR